MTELAMKSCSAKESDLTELVGFPPWRLGSRITFRLVFAYLVLYNFPLPTALNELPITGSLMERYDGLWRQVVPWFARHVLHLSYDISVFTNGSGDTTYDYVRALCFLTLAAIATLIWSLLDRDRSSYQRLYHFLTIFVRFSLASSMILYGIIKVIPPYQFQAPSLSRLMQPYGDSSPQGLLWTFMGYSQSYTRFAGLIELSGGLLLVVPRTASLGAIVSLIAMTQVLMINLCYDVPVKLYSFHLLLMSAFLVIPIAGQLFDLLLRNRRVEPVEIVPLFKRRWLNRSLAIAQIVFGACLLGLFVWQNSELAKEYDLPNPPLYGIWLVEEFEVDGEIQPALITGGTRWKRVFFDDAYFFAIERMNDTRERLLIDLNADDQTFSLRKRPDRLDPSWKADFSWQLQDPEVIVVDGEFDGARIRAKLRRIAEPKFLLTNRGFHWINETPFNR